MRWFGRRRTQLGAAAALVGLAVVTAAVRSEAASESNPTLTVPSAPGQTATLPPWRGTIPPGTHPTNTCNGVGTAAVDSHAIDIVTPPGNYDAIDATFTFEITWKPPSGDENTADEILTVNRASDDQGDTENAEVGSSDGGTTTETVVAHNLAPGTYDVVACGFANAAPQDYTATVSVQTASVASEAGVASADTDGLAFSSATAADPQRDE